MEENELTPEEIAAAVREFVNATGYNQYKGARYVPTFGRFGEDSVEWDNSAPYEPLTIVLYEGNSYTSRIPVPIGIDISNTEYWAQTGEFDARVEHLRTLVLRYQAQIDANRQAISAEVANRTAADTELQASIGAEATARSEADQAIIRDMETADTQLSNSITDLRSSLNTLSDSLASEQTARATADSQLQQSLDTSVASLQLSDQTLSEALTAQGQRVGILEFGAKALSMGGYVAPVYEGSFESDEQHAACVRVGDYVYTFSPNNYDSTGTVRVWDLNTNSLHTSYNNVQMGHGNSVAYDGTYIYVLPLNTYSSGTGTRSDKLYRYPTNMSGRTEMQLPSSHPYGVSYDWITQTLYYVDTTNQTNDLYLYQYNYTSGEWTLAYSISNELFALTGFDNGILWQDFAVYDGILYATKLDGTTFMISLAPLGICGTFRIGGMNSTTTWRLGEVEGLEFDSDGILWNMRTYSLGFRNTDEHHEHAIGIVTTLNTRNTARPDDSLLFKPYGTLTIVSPTKFCLNRYELHSINEAMLRFDKFYRIEVPSGYTYSDKKVRILGDMVLHIVGTMSIADTIEVDMGHTCLFVDGGTVNFTGRSAAIDASSKACQVSLRNNGTINIGGNITKFVNFGYTPSLFAVNSMGNLTDILVNDSTHVYSTCLCMGSYKVYGGGA